MTGLVLVSAAAASVAYRLGQRSRASGSTRIVEPARHGAIRFQNRQSRSRIEFVLNNGTTPDKPIIDSMLGGVALLDFDRDGWLDIFFTNGAEIPSLQKQDRSFYNRLYRNLGNGAFADVTESAGVTGIGYSMGAATGDFDNDGYPDLYVTGVNANILYRNNRAGTFSDVTEKAGVSGRLPRGKKAWSVAAIWLDYNRDRFLDLFVVNYLHWSPEINRTCGDPSRRLSCSPVMYEGLPNLLYRNNGDGTFTDVSATTGIGEHIGKGMGAAVADYDQDGFLDIFVANDSERNFLFRNINGTRFEEIGVQAAVAFTEDGIPVSSMGVDFRALNNDGLPDVTITALANETFPLFLNTGQGYFIDATYPSGIGPASYTMSGWGNGIFDFDNDGLKDILTVGGHVSENIEKYLHQKYMLPNAVWQNLGGGRFQSVGGQAGPAFEKGAAHRGAAFGDLDNDGRVDVVVSVIGEKPEILYNVSTREHNWILIDLEGTANNQDGIGASIRLVSDSGLVQYNHVTSSVGYASSSDRRVHFGVGSDRRVRQIEVVWPGGKRQLVGDVAVNQVFRIKEE